MGRSVSPLDALHHGNEFPRGDELSKQEKISFQNAYQLDRQNGDDGGECVESPNDIEFNAFGGKKEDCTIYVRSVSPQRNSNTEIGETDVIFQQQVNSGVKSESYTSIIECCPNQERTQTLQSSMGQLLRIGTLAGTTWTKEIPKTPCHLVVPNVKSRGANIPETMSPVPAGGKQDEVRGCRNSSTNPLMIVDMIASESDRCRVATYINRNLESGDPPICYMRDVKQFGFDHIIIIGKRYCGLLFLDCFGRVFDWDSMSDVLWPLGDYWNLTTKESRTSSIVWGLEFDGTIVEFEDGM